MISLRFETKRLRGHEAGIYGFAADGKKPSRKGRFQLWPQEEANEIAGDGIDPALEGDDAAELDAEAKRLGATKVTHWYEP